MTDLVRGEASESDEEQDKHEAIDSCLFKYFFLIKQQVVTDFCC